jgi:hypothetical protein
MDETGRDTLMRMAAFEHVRRLGEVRDHLTATELKPGFVFDGERIPLINPQRGIFKPQQMQFLLSIKTVLPKPGGKVWYDDQREVHRQIFEDAPCACLGSGSPFARYAVLQVDSGRASFEHIAIPIISPPPGARKKIKIPPGRISSRPAAREIAA